MRKDFYVYLHRDVKGSIFYVGKGTGERAWSKDRHAAWLKYVETRLNGEYDVEIHLKNLDEIEALELEDKLIYELGDQLINWVNPGRKINYEENARFHKLRDKNRKYVEATKAIEKEDIDKAVERYLKALSKMREYEEISWETGLVAEMNVGPGWGDPNILDRLTMCLMKAKRYEEATIETSKYFEDFPSAIGMSVGKRIIKRINKIPNQEPIEKAAEE